MEGVYAGRKPRHHDEGEFPGVRQPGAQREEGLHFSAHRIAGRQQDGGCFYGAEGDSRSGAACQSINQGCRSGSMFIRRQRSGCAALLRRSGRRGSLGRILRLKISASGRRATLPTADWRGETVDGHKTYKVEATPVDSSRSQYKYIYYWVAQDVPVILFAEMYDAQGRKVRVLHATDLKKEGGSGERGTRRCGRCRMARGRC